MTEREKLFELTAFIDDIGCKLYNVKSKDEDRIKDIYRVLRTKHFETIDFMKEDSERNEAYYRYFLENVVKKSLKV